MAMLATASGLFTEPKQTSRPALPPAPVGAASKQVAHDETLALLSTTLPSLKQQLRVAVIYNGDQHAPGAVINPTYNPRSNKSYRPVAEDIAATLRALGFQHVVTLPDDMRLGDALVREGIEFAWINSAGIQGDVGASHTPAMLEMMGIPYVGHNPLNASLLDNKHAFKHGLQAMGIPTARFVTWDPCNGPFAHARDTHFARIFGGYAGPFIVKPTSGRASLNVETVDCREDLDDVVRRIGDLTGNSVLVEEFLGGAEYTVGVFGPLLVRHGQLSLAPGPVVVSPLERALEPGERIFTSMDVKPITADRARLLDPVRDHDVHERLADLARRIHRDFHLTTLVRVDIRADAEGELRVLEANPKPDLKAPAKNQTNLVSMGLERLGMQYDDFILSLLLNSLYFYLRHKPACMAHILRWLA